MPPPGVRPRYNEVPVGQTISPLLFLPHHRQVKMSPIIQNPAPAFTVSAFVDGAFFVFFLPPYCFLTMFKFRVILMFYPL